MPHALGLMAGFYMLVSVRSATSTTQGGKREYSLFGRYEKFKLVTENENLKAKIKALQDQLQQGDARKMAAAAAAAATAAAAPAPRASPGDAPRVISEPAPGGAGADAAPRAHHPPPHHRRHPHLLQLSAAMAWSLVVASSTG